MTLVTLYNVYKVSRPIGGDAFVFLQREGLNKGWGMKLLSFCIRMELRISYILLTLFYFFYYPT